MNPVLGRTIIMLEQGKGNTQEIKVKEISFRLSL